MTTTVEPLRGPTPRLPLDLPLSAALREGSRVEHERAESAPFVTDLFGAGVTADRYAAYLRRLLVVYATLEEQAQAAPADHLVAGFDDRRLDRAAALRADLAHWTRGVPPAEPDPSPAARAYAARLRVAAGSPTLLLAHHYTRYLGDLAGGRAVGAVLARRHDLTEGGAAFYAFPGLGRSKAYRDAYKARLDALRLGEGVRQELVAEVRMAFLLNLDLLNEV